MALIDGASDPAPEEWGKTTDEEQSDSGIGSWPGVTVAVKPPNHTLKLYGGAAFERAMHEFQCATYSIECPLVSREKVKLILFAEFCSWKLITDLHHCGRSQIYCSLMPAEEGVEA